MAFASSGSFLPSTVQSADPITITVNRTVNVGDVALIFISHKGNNVSITGVTDSEGNDWAVQDLTNSGGTVGIAVCSVGTTLTSGVSTVSVNLSSATRTIVRGSSYSGIGSQWISSATKSATGPDYGLSWAGGGDGVAFVMFHFPSDYGFADDTISGWTQVFVTDDVSGVQSQQVFRKEVASGTVTCQNDSISLPYLATGFVLPYMRSGFGQAVVVL